MQVPNSERLLYRLLDLENAKDSERVFDLDQDPEVMKHINGGTPSTPSLHQRGRERVAKFRNPERGWGLWGVFDKDEGGFLGWVLVRPIGFFTASPQLNNLEIGWRFLRASWGRGYATEAAFAVTSVFAQHQDVSYFSAFVAPENLASVRVIEKLGLRVDPRVPEMEPGYADGAVFYTGEAKLVELHEA